MGKTPVSGRLFSSFPSPPLFFFFVLPAAFQFQAAGVKEEGDEGKGVGVGGCLPFWCSGFFPSQPGGPVWSFAVRGVKSVFGRE